jgi:hypothetical protein
MRFYLAKKYLANTLLIMIVCALLAGARGPDAIILAAMVSAILSAVVTYWQFNRRNLWVLYDNLRYSAWGYLSLYAITFGGCVIGLGNLFK